MYTFSLSVREWESSTLNTLRTFSFVIKRKIKRNGMQNERLPISISATQLSIFDLYLFTGSIFMYKFGTSSISHWWISQQIDLRKNVELEQAIKSNVTKLSVGQFSTIECHLNEGQRRQHSMEVSFCHFWQSTIQFDMRSLYFCVLTHFRFYQWVFDYLCVFSRFNEQNSELTTYQVIQVCDEKTFAIKRTFATPLNCLRTLLRKWTNGFHITINISFSANIWLDIAALQCTFRQLFTEATLLFLFLFEVIIAHLKGFAKIDSLSNIFSLHYLRSEKCIMQWMIWIN